MSDIIDSFISNKSFFRGSVNLGSDLQVEGDYDGIINSTKDLYINSTGRIKGTIKAKNVFIYGIVKGFIYADKVFISKDSIFLGNINSKTLEVEQGAIIHGEFAIKKDKEVTFNDVETFQEIDHRYDKIEQENKNHL